MIKRSKKLLYCFYALIILLVLSNLIFIHPASNERRFSLSLIQTLMGLPVMAGLYLYAGFNLKPHIVPLLLFSETVFSLTTFFMAFRLERAVVKTTQEPLLFILAPVVLGAAATALSLYFAVYIPPARITDNFLIFEMHGPLYIGAIFILISAFGN